MNRIFDKPHRIVIEWVNGKMLNFDAVQIESTHDEYIITEASREIRIPLTNVVRVII